SPSGGPQDACERRSRRVGGRGGGHGAAVHSARLNPDPQSVRLPSPTTVRTSVPAHHPIVSLLGTRDHLLKLVEDAFDVDILVRGNEIVVRGGEDEANQVVHVYEQLFALLDKGQELDEADVNANIAMVRSAEHPQPAEVLSDEA